MKIINCAGYKDAFWFELFGIIFLFKRSAPLFSERYGYRKYYNVPFTQWRFHVEKRK